MKQVNTGGQINFNTVLIIIVGGLITLAITKADKAFTTITQLEDRQQELTRRMENVESFLGVVIPPVQSKKPSTK